MHFNTEKKLCIIGSADSVYDFDYKDDSYDIWALSVALNEQDVKRIDVLFELHNDKIIKNLIDNVGVDFNKLDIPVYVQNNRYENTRKYIKNAVTFPLKELLAFAERKDFTCSLSYLLVYAVMVGYREIYLHKFLFNAFDDYAFEKPNIEYWIRTLKLRFSDVHFYWNNDNELFDENYLYGYESAKNLSKFKSKKKLLWELFNKHFGDYLNYFLIYHQNYGKLEFMNKISGQSIEKIKEIFNKELKSLENKDLEGSVKNSYTLLNQVIGAIQISDQYDNYIR